jgi:hypothetical protein
MRSDQQRSRDAQPSQGSSTMTGGARWWQRARWPWVAIGGGVLAVSLLGFVMLALGATRTGQTRQIALIRTPAAHNPKFVPGFVVSSPTALAGASSQSSQIRSIQVTADRSTVSCPTADTGSSTQVVNFTAIIHVLANRHGYTIAGSFSGADLAASLVAASPPGWVTSYPVPANATTVTVYYQLSLTPSAANGSYGVQFAATDPSHHLTQSNIATVTKQCSS